MPRVSVIVPVFNTEKYLRRCIASIASQTFREFEVIIVDDGSTDNSFELCMALTASYDNMHVVRKPNGGLSSARLFGLNNSKGDFVVFVDSDDYLAADYLSTLYDAISTHSADISMCAYYTDDGNELAVQSLCQKQPVVILEREDILKKYMLPQLPSSCDKDEHLPSFMWIRMFRRKILTEDLFVSERDVYQEDLALSLLIYKKIERIAVVNKPSYYYCINPGSLTLRYRDNLQNMLRNMYGIINRCIDDGNRNEILNRKIGFVLWAILYLLRNSSHKGFCEYVKTVFFVYTEKSFCKSLLHTNIFKISNKYKLLVFCYWTALLPMLYVYHKKTR